mmetsp:Transcript_10342/g.22100  ORF Transcript_10342/g.22100 Transcript_10342/m.22100 type:complete len:343 (+) Transcript_10342:151-1179(+)
METHGGDIETTNFVNQNHDGLSEQFLLEYYASNVVVDWIDSEDLNGIVVGTNSKLKNPIHDIGDTVCGQSPPVENFLSQQDELVSPYFQIQGRVLLEVTTGVNIVFFQDRHGGVGAFLSVDLAILFVGQMTGLGLVSIFAHDAFGVLKVGIDRDIPHDFDARGVIKGMDEGTLGGCYQLLTPPSVDGHVSQKDTAALESNTGFAAEVSTDQQRDGVVVSDGKVVRIRKDGTHRRECKPIGILAGGTGKSGTKIRTISVLVLLGVVMFPNVFVLVAAGLGNVFDGFNGFNLLLDVGVTGTSLHLAGNDVFLVLARNLHARTTSSLLKHLSTSTPVYVCSCWHL